MLKRVSLQLFTSLLLCSLCLGLKAAGMNEGGFLKAKQGVIVYPDIPANGSAKAVGLQVVTDNIIRVTASPTNTLSDMNGFVVNYLSVLITPAYPYGPKYQAAIFKCITINTTFLFSKPIIA